MIQQPTANPPISAAQPGKPTSPIGRFFSPGNRYLPPVLITLILVAGQVKFGLLESFSRTALAIATAMVVDSLLARLVVKKWPNLASAYITGISVGILLRSPEFWPYALCSAIAITSKYVIRWKGRHLWNPSNFAIAAMLILAPEYVATLSIQWGNDIWPMIIVWILGALITWRVKRFHITLTYVLSFFVLSAVRAVIVGDSFLAEAAPITGPMYQLFIFFMITDPRTTVKSVRGQCIVAFLVAVAEMLLRLAGNVDAPYYALTIVGPVAMIVDLWRQSNRQAPARQLAESAARS
ncbi:MAG TPA: RnfABCDGE type electron transport complex subunit D [Bryobacteraceae bacterium]|nr:RnfABCDGE type electron transport complex subunit D [Bryobacteraceae bacterium]